MARKPRKTKPKFPTRSRGFATSLGALDDALASFWFSTPVGHARLNESERRALCEHLESKRFAIVPQEATLGMVADYGRSYVGSEVKSGREFKRRCEVAKGDYEFMVLVRPKWGER